MAGKLIEWLLAHPDLLLTAGLTVLAWIKGKPWLEQAKKSKRTQLILQLAEMAFFAVEELNRIHKLPDSATKVAAFMERLLQAAKASGLGELSDDEKAMALQKVDSIHVAMKAAEERMPNTDMALPGVD